MCEEHFERYFMKRVKRVLRRVKKGSSILVGVSGGKDSIAALHSVYRLAPEFNLKVGAAMIYSPVAEDCRKVFEEITGELGVEGLLINVEDWGIKIPRENPYLACIVCGVVTRYLLNRYAVENGYDYVATGHNLDDMAYFAINNLITHSLQYLYHQFDSVTEPLPKYRMAGKVKPLFWVSDMDSFNYVKLMGLSSCNTKCPHEGRDKQAFIKPLLNQLRERWPTALINLVTSVRELARKAAPSERKINLCERCGYPTSGRVCAFCRLREKLEVIS